MNKILIVTIFLLVSSCEVRPDWQLVKCKGQSNVCAEIEGYTERELCIDEARIRNRENFNQYKYGCAPSGGN